jgi:hypothetical protein
MKRLNLYKYTLSIIILIFSACDTPKNEIKIHHPEDLKKIKKIALVTFCAKEKVSFGEFSSSNFESKQTAMPELVQFVTKEYATKLHNSLLKELNLVSLNFVKQNMYWQTLKGKYPLEYKVKKLFLPSSRKLINALPDLTVYIPESETGVFAKLASNLNTDAILWIMCDFYLDVHSTSNLISGSAGSWTGEVQTVTKLFNSEGKLIWEASHFYKSKPMEGADTSWWKKLDTKQRISGQTMASLLLDATEVSINRVIINLKTALQ